MARVPAAEIEAHVVQVIRSSAQKGRVLLNGAGEIDAGSLIEQALDRVVIRKGAVEIWGVAQDGAEAPQPVTLPWTPVPSRRKRAIILSAGLTEDPRPIRAETRARLVEGIAKARRWLDELTTGRMTDTKQIARREGCSERSVRMTLNLAFLSPEIMRAAVEGRLPHGVGTTRLADTPPCWRAQTKELFQPAEGTSDS